MSDVSAEDGSVSSDDFSGSGQTPISVNQTVNQAQAQSNAQQQQQQQGGFTPVAVTPFIPGQSQSMSGPSILIPLDSHVQAQGLLAQLQALLGL